MLLLYSCHYFSSRRRRGIWIRRAHALVVVIGVFVFFLPLVAAALLLILCFGYALWTCLENTYLIGRNIVYDTYLVLKWLLLNPVLAILEELERDAAPEYKAQ